MEQSGSATIVTVWRNIRQMSSLELEQSSNGTVWWNIRQMEHSGIGTIVKWHCLVEYSSNGQVWNWNNRQMALFGMKRFVNHGN